MAKSEEITFFFVVCFSGGVAGAVFSLKVVFILHEVLLNMDNFRMVIFDL